MSAARAITLAVAGLTGGAFTLFAYKMRQDRSKLEDELKRVEGEKDVVEEESVTLQKSLVEIQVKSRDQDAIVGNIKKIIRDKDDLAEENKKIHEELERTRDSFTQQIDDLEEQKRSEVTKARAEEARRVREQTKKEIEKQREQWNEEKSEEFQKVIVNLMNEKEDLARKMKEKDDVLHTTNEELRIVRSEMGKMSREFEKVEDERRVMDSQAEHIKYVEEQLVNFRTKNEDLETRMAKLFQERENITSEKVKEINALEDVIKEMREKHDRLEEAYDKTNEILREREHSYKENVDIINDLKKDYASVKQQEQQLATLKQDILVKDRMISQMKRSSHVRLEKKSAKIQQELFDKDKQIAELEQKIERIEREKNTQGVGTDSAPGISMDKHNRLVQENKDLKEKIRLMSYRTDELEKKSKMGLSDKMKNLHTENEKLKVHNLNFAQSIQHLKRSKMILEREKQNLSLNITNLRNAREVEAASILHNEQLDKLKIDNKKMKEMRKRRVHYLKKQQQVIINLTAKLKNLEVEKEPSSKPPLKKRLSGLFSSKLKKKVNSLKKKNKKLEQSFHILQIEKEKLEKEKVKEIRQVKTKAKKRLSKIENEFKQRVKKKDEVIGNLEKTNMNKTLKLNELEQSFDGEEITEALLKFVSVSGE